MRTLTVRFACVAAAVFALTSSLAADVKVAKDANGGVSVAAAGYSASFDAAGNLLGVTVKESPAFRHVFGTPGKPPTEAPTVNVVNQMVSVRSGQARVEWTFTDDSIKIVQEGYEFECAMDKSVKSIVASGGKGGPLMAYNGGSLAIVLSNGLTVGFSTQMHVHGLRLLPGGYTNGSLAKGKLFEAEFKLGAPAEAVQMLGGVGIAPMGNNVGVLSDGGIVGNGMIHFADANKIVFTTSQTNISPEKMDLEYRLSVVDHYVAGKEVAADHRPLTIDPNDRGSLRWEIPPLGPGFYYLTVGVYRGETRLTESKQTFAVDLANYSHPQTRPDNFVAFWACQEKKLKDSPATPQVTELAAQGLDGKAYEVALPMPDGFKIHGCLVVPAKPATTVTTFGSLISHTLDDMIAQIKAGKYATPPGVSFTIDLPEEATYTRWAGAEDNNLLQCVLVYLRSIDFLAERPEVKPDRIVVNGASRSGPLAVILAARRPKNICGVSAFVHTSAGISWQDKPYLSWGCPGWYKATDPNAVQRLAAMAAYVDPVNHVADVTCPIWFGYGIDDNLAQPQGIEAMYHLCPAKWKRLSRNEGGHQYSTDMKTLAKGLLDQIGAGATSAPGQESTLKEH